MVNIERQEGLYIYHLTMNTDCLQYCRGLLYDPQRGPIGDKRDILSFLQHFGYAQRYAEFQQVGRQSFLEAVGIQAFLS